MLSNQVLQHALDELRAITRVDLCVMDLEGKAMASTFGGQDIPREAVCSFANSPADSQAAYGYHFFKIFDDQEPVSVLISRGAKEDASMIGKVAVCQIQNLLTAYRERLDRNHFMRNLLTERLPSGDVYHQAGKLHIALRARRVVFIIETRNGQDGAVLETLKSLFANRPKDFILPMDEKTIVLVRELAEAEAYETCREAAGMVRDMLNSEVMSAVRVAYGEEAKELKAVPRSFQEAKIALEVGKIFYAQRDTISYGSLGIGRLIYQLPLPLCERFMGEIFGERLPEALDEEILSVVHPFFENNLNVSETARQLYVHRNTLMYRLEKIQKSTGLDIRMFEDAMTFQIALMVVSYMKYMKNQD